MTNKHLVEEINRQIRGIAQNYPDGLPAIRAQLEALSPPAEPEKIVPPSRPLPSPFRDLTEPVKRGPGRPRKTA